MKQSNYRARWIAVGLSAIALSGAGTAAATTEPPDTTPATQAAGTEPAGESAGASNCPAITEEAAGTEAAGTEAEGTAAEGTAAEGSTPAVSGPFVQVVESDEYGTVLVDRECRALYMFESDTDGEPTCVDDCAIEWPPLFVPDDSLPPLADELDPSLFSVVDHPDGPMLKVGDWPLYYFAHDTGPAQFNGQGVDAFGGLWWLVAPDGTVVDNEGEANGTEAAAEGTEASEGTEAAPIDTVVATTESY